MTKRIDATAAVALVVLWSSGFVGSELGTRYASAHTLLAWRFVAAFVVLGIVVAVTGMRTTRAGVVRQIGLGLFLQCLYLGCVFSAVDHGVPAGVAALVASLQPLVVAIASGPLLGERTTPTQRVGLIVGIVGVAIVVLGDLSGSDAPWWTYLLPVVGMAAMAVGTLAERRLRPAEPIALSLMIQVGVAAPIFLGWSAIAGDLVPPMTVQFWGSVAWLVVFSTFGGLGAYLFVVRRSGATRASTLLYLTPPTTMLWAWLMFDDAVPPSAYAGLVVCAVGVVLVLRTPRGAQAGQASAATRSTASSTSPVLTK